MSTYDALNFSGSPRVWASPGAFQPKRHISANAMNTPAVVRYVVMKPSKAYYCNHRSRSGLPEAVQAAVVCAKDDAAGRHSGRCRDCRACIKFRKFRTLHEIQLVEAAVSGPRKHAIPDDGGR